MKNKKAIITIAIVLAALVIGLLVWKTPSSNASEEKQADEVLSEPEELTGAPEGDLPIEGEIDSVEEEDSAVIYQEGGDVVIEIPEGMGTGGF